MKNRRSHKKPGHSPEKRTVVKSHAYGPHERAARGTRSKAELNEAMKAHGQRMIGSNLPAKLIFDALKPFRIDFFTGGMIWQKLVRHFAAQAKTGQPYSVTGIVHWDLNQAYPTSRVMTADLKITADSSEGTLHILLNYALSDRFLQRHGAIDAFQLTVIVLFPDFIQNEIITVPTLLPIKPLSDTAPVTFIVQIPSGVRSYIACLKAEPCKKGLPEKKSGNANKVMCLMEPGLL